MRKITRQVKVGDVLIGGGGSISVQSMLNTKTTDIDGCLAQIKELNEVGCDLIRLAVPDEQSAKAFSEIAQKCRLPLIADIHYSYKLAELALDAGAAKIRMNPGNMSTDKTSLKALAEKMKDKGVPVRVGVNGGSLDKRFKGMSEDDALVASALDCAESFESVGFSDIVIAIKHSDVEIMRQANTKLSASCDYPIHLGVTEAGTLRSGLIKSSIGIGSLLEKGIGDTFRISLSASPIEEVMAAKTLLKVLKLKENCVEVVSCPTCARTEIDVQALAEEVELLTAKITKPLKIAVMGCPLNGIGEGAHSDIGIAGGKEKSILMFKGEIYKTVKSEDLREEFLKLLSKVL